MVGDVVREVPTCRIDTAISDVVDHLGRAPRMVVVTTGAGVVLGKLVPRHADEAPDTVARDVMIEGPTTVRASETVHALTHRMEDADTSSVLVTTKEGFLLGVFLLEPRHR